MLHSEWLEAPSRVIYEQRELIPEDSRCHICDGFGAYRARNSQSGKDWRMCWACDGSGKKQMVALTNAQVAPLPSITLAEVREALKRMGECNDVVKYFKLSTQTRNQLVERLKPIAVRFSGLAAVELRVDETVSPGIVKIFNAKDELLEVVRI